MKIQIHKPQGFAHKGKREHNEDTVFPTLTTSSSDNKLFLVCDGVGGAQKGEIASHLVAHGFSDYFNSNPPTPVITQDYLGNGLQNVETKINDYIIKHPECSGMATTATLLYFDEKGVILAWAGDSRIYHFRNGEIVFKTSDHSLVNELIKQGHITEAQAATHPQRNIILRAIKGSENKTQLDFHRIQDIQKGDHFLLCSDGVMESFNDQELTQVFASGKSAERISQEIVDKCEQHSNDNFSGYIIEVNKVSVGQENTGPKSKNMINRILVGLLVLIISFVLFKFILGPSSVEKEAKILLTQIETALEEKNYPKVIELSDKMEGLDPSKFKKRILEKSEALKDSALVILSRIDLDSSKTEQKSKELGAEAFFNLRKNLELNKELLLNDPNDQSLVSKINDIKEELKAFPDAEVVGFLVKKACETINNGDPKAGERMLNEAKDLVTERKLKREIDIQEELTKCQALLI